ncbi:MAG: cyclic nucleotide-binding domain-containing protein [Bradymonadales bacterium]|nr:MAG: cyclic nucleotide-binding domain-containing protein [Bradymonadales bacterium]
MGRFTSLESSELCKDWRLEDRAALAQFLEKQELKAGEHLFFEKSVEQKLYFIDSGRLKIQFGSYHTELGPGESLGELSLVAKQEKQITATALDLCLFWVITEGAWSRMKHEAPEVATRLLESIQMKYARLLSSNVAPPQLSSAGTEPTKTV